MTVRPRGRPRNEGHDAAILTATIDVVAEVGFAALTVDAVARRAGVGKATIYRRWSSKEAMMLDAWVSFSQPPATPDTGSFRSDLAAYFAPKENSIPTDTVQRVFPQMIAAAKVNPEVNEAYRAFIAERRRPLRTLIERAVARGEVPADIDIDIVQDLLIAPLIYRLLITDMPTDDTVMARLIDVVLVGVGAGATTPTH